MQWFRVNEAFPASHRIRIDRRGTLEPIHQHRWRVAAWLETAKTPAPVAIEARRVLRRWVDRVRGGSFNRVRPFDEVNPTAEHVARVLAEDLQRALPDARVERVDVGEAEGFSASFWPRVQSAKK